MSVYSERRWKLLARSENVAVARPENLFYFTEFFGSGVGILKPDSTLLVTTRLEADRADSVGEEVEVIRAANRGELWKLVAKNVARGACVIDDDAEARGHRFVRGAELFQGARRKKDEEEARRIRTSSAILDEIFGMIEEELRPGVTERWMASKIVGLAVELGAAPSGFEGSMSPTILASGENGAWPHAEVTDRRIKEGDFVIADLTFRYRGYCSDATRTFAVGRATHEMKRRYAAVLDAQLIGEEASSEGTSCGEVHDAVASRLDKDGLLPYFLHGTGHGVGIQVHEMPSLRHGDKTKLQRGDSITIEPGVYFRGKYGVRIEDTLLINERAEPLNHYPKELVVVG